MNQISISPTAAEYQAAERAVISRLQRSVPGISIARFGTVLGVLLMVVALAGLTKAEYPAHVKTNLSAMGTVALLVTGFVIHQASVWLANWRAARHLYRKDSKLLRPFSVQLSPEALQIASVGAHSQIMWSQVEEVVVAQDNAIIFTGPTHAIPLPARCFSSLEVFNAFTKELVSLSKQHAA